MEISPETVCYFIMKAREFDVKVGAEDVDVETEVEEDAEAAIFESRRGDPVVAELTELVNGLDVDEQVDLVALAWLGRGDFDKSEWRECRAAARDAHNAHTAEYLLGTPLVSDFLEEGLAQLGYSCEDVERDHL